MCFLSHFTGLLTSYVSASYYAREFADFDKIKYGIALIPNTQKKKKKVFFESHDAFNSSANCLHKKKEKLDLL